MRCVQELFRLVTVSSHYRLAKIPSDPGFYAFIYFYNGTNIALAPSPHLVGKTLHQIFAARNLLGEISSTELIASFIANAEAGGGWTWYPWKNAATVAAPLKNKYAYVTRGPGLYDGEKYYVGVGFLTGNALPWTPLVTCVAGASSLCTFVARLEILCFVWFVNVSRAVRQG